ncbi:unnamed protein product, partial [Linum tenue]
MVDGAIKVTTLKLTYARDCSREGLEAANYFLFIYEQSSKTHIG